MFNFIVVLLAVVLYVFNSPFYQLVNPVSYSVSLPKKFEGPLAPNEALETTERLHENALHWPESFAVHKGEIYTGLGDGRIVRVSDTKITEITRTGTECAGQHEEHICGRPLGMTFNKAGELYLVDAYHGLFSVDVKTGKKVNLLPSKTVVEDLPLTLLNSLTFDEKEEVLYITQSSTRWNLGFVIVSIFEHDSSGRLLKYNLKTKAVSVILKDLAFPNGVELTHDGAALMVAEGSNNKIFKYYIKGEKAGLNKELPIKLPGEPDNISRNSRGNYWVSVATAHSQENPSLIHKLSDKPFWRQVLLHVHRLATFPITSIMSYLPSKYLQELAFEIHTMRVVADLLPGYGLIIEFDDNGKMLRSLHAPSGKVNHISEILEMKGSLYLASWRNHYIGKLKL